MFAGLSELQTVLLLSLFPAVGSAIGVGLARWIEPGDRFLGMALHGAAGIATAVAAIELVPRAAERIAPVLLAGCLVGGALLSAALAKLSGRFSKASGGKLSPALGGAYVAIWLDLAIDGAMTGSGSTVSLQLGLLLAISQVVANIPGSFAITASLQAAGTPSKRIWIMTATYPLTPMLGAFLGFVSLRSASLEATGVVLAILAGILLLATVEDLVPQADKPGAPRGLSSAGFASGFAFLFLMSSYFGS